MEVPDAWARVGGYLDCQQLQMVERRNKTVYDKALERIDKLYEQLQEAQESIATECADVAAEFEDELAAAKEVIDQQKYEIDSLYAGWLFTESYTVDYIGTYRIIRQIEKDAEKAQAEFDEASGIHAVQAEHIGNDCQIFSLTGETFGCSSSWYGLHREVPRR